MPAANRFFMNSRWPSVLLGQCKFSTTILTESVSGGTMAVLQCAGSNEVYCINIFKFSAVQCN